MKPSSGKQDKLQLGDSDGRGSCLNDSCLQPSRGSIFLHTLAHPGWPLNDTQLPLAAAESTERAPSPTPLRSAAVQHTPPVGPRGLGRAGLAGDCARGAQLYWGSFGRRWREAESNVRGEASMPRGFASGAFSPSTHLLGQRGGECTASWWPQHGGSCRQEPRCWEVESRGQETLPNPSLPTCPWKGVYAKAQPSSRRASRGSGPPG